MPARLSASEWLHVRQFIVNLNIWSVYHSVGFLFFLPGPEVVAVKRGCSSIFLPAATVSLFRNGSAEFSLSSIAASNAEAALLSKEFTCGNTEFKALLSSVKVVCSLFKRDVAISRCACVPVVYSVVSVCRIVYKSNLKMTFRFFVVDNMMLFLHHPLC